MTPLDFERWFKSNERDAPGGLSPPTSLTVEEGDTVGVVLLGSGGPAAPGDVEEALYTLYMDPLRVRLPVGGRLRHWLCRAAARVRAGRMRETYEVIGGGSPMPRLAADQAKRVQHRLNERYGTPTGVDFRVTVGMRYGPPSIDTAATRLADEGVDHVVLIPLFPQYARATTGSVFSYWTALGTTGERPQWPTTAVAEYAAHPKYVRALSERISEGLQRFRHDRRGDVHLLFSAHGTPRHDQRAAQDPYCCQVHTTVDRVMEHRASDRPYHVAFRTTTGPSRSLTPSTEDALRAIAREGGQSVLVVPTSVITDHRGTRYTLDMEARAVAEAQGIDRYEVASGLNTHPLCIETLSEAVVAQLTLPVNVNQLRVGENGSAPEYALRPPSEVARVDPAHRTTECGDCTQATAPRRWDARQDSA